MERILVVGMGVTGEAVVRFAGADRVTVVEDRPSDSSRARAAALGVALVESPDEQELAQLLGGIDLVVPSPGVSPAHAVYRLAGGAGVEVVSEPELAFRSARVPVVAVTGTNGKTTVTTMVAAMLVAGGKRAVAAGNIGLPMVDAVTQDVDVIVAEVSSFQLQFTSTFKPAVGVWLNFAEDHLDWHPSMEDYAAAKERIWANQGPGDTAVANAGDAVVMAAARRTTAAVVTFGRDGDYRVVDGVMTTPGGDGIIAVDQLPRQLPHDVDNGLAASAAAIAAGASPAECASVLESFGGLPHRVTLIGDAGGVQFYDDSKATTPASVIAALRGFTSVVLIAGGRNKGLDLDVLAGEVERVRAVVAIGDAAGEVEHAFAGRRPVTVASNMTEAVAAAVAQARPGDAVLLSPGCASFDWYSSYAERGDDFVRAVREVVG